MLSCFLISPLGWRLYLHFARAGNGNIWPKILFLPLPVKQPRCSSAAVSTETVGSTSTPPHSARRQWDQAHLGSLLLTSQQTAGVRFELISPFPQDQYETNGQLTPVSEYCTCYFLLWAVGQSLELRMEKDAIRNLPNFTWDCWHIGRSSFLEKDILFIILHISG